LEVVLQERYDQYSDFGSAAKPKFLLRYKPLDDLTLRATYSEGYRAPSLPELFSGSFVEQAALVDPKNPQLGTQTYFVHVQGNFRRQLHHQGI
jgi:iron complex outermembrane receptor protein